MKRRALAMTAATAGLILVPTAAMADYANPGAIELSTANPVAGETFTVRVDTDEYDEVALDIVGPDEVDDDDIEIAGQNSSSAPVEDGTATFDVTLNGAGSYTIAAYGPADDRTLIDSVTIDVAAAGEGDDDSDGDDAGDDEGGGLPDTGAGNSTPLIIGSATLLAAGAAVLVFARSQQKRV